MVSQISFRLIAINWSDVLQTYAFFIMQDYLTNVWGLSFTHAAGILNIWEGTQRILPVFFLWLLDEFTRDTTLVVLSTVANAIGLACIAMSTPPVLANLTGTCKQYEAKCIGRTQKILFYVGMALVAMGLAGRKVVKLKPKDKIQEGQELPVGKIVLAALVTLGLVIMPRILAVGLPNITLWSVRLGVPTICTAVATLFFLTDLTSFKRHERTGSSPVTTVLRVFVACAFKITKPAPRDVNDLYMQDQTEAHKHTQSCCLGCQHRHCQSVTSSSSRIQSVTASSSTMCNSTLPTHPQIIPIPKSYPYPNHTTTHATTHLCN